MYGIKNFSAVINPPQACILAVGGGRKVATGASFDGEMFAASSVTTVTLSYDQRVVDAEEASQWLQAFKNYMENPVLLM